jgi:hypothetical protein
MVIIIEWLSPAAIISDETDRGRSRINIIKEKNKKAENTGLIILGFFIILILRAQNFSDIINKKLNM